MSQTVLILEDSRTQAAIISKMFQKAGFTPVCVSEEQAAKTRLKEEAFDLLLLDVFIEGTNTLDALDEYRQLAPRVPIAIMTAGHNGDAEAGADALNKARRHRVNFLLPKPFYYVDVVQVCADVDAYWTSLKVEALAENPQRLTG
ncbi:response regulator [Asticcacaulis sp. BYS171W]|uniref:Response regulator n=1 Tax=Asticcacaulis aquaticus TaxID=2984212 RepID=A0ABT5HYW3_9CAUL|nr:response regulator [Asticcacaulis aquaticus]MDC7685275.1 response regulator [Asticcacaulis aquaticus]